MFERARFPLPQRNLRSVERDGRSGTREDEKGRFSQTPRLISIMIQRDRFMMMTMNGPPLARNCGYKHTNQVYVATFVHTTEIT